MQMPDLTLTHYALLAGALILGVVLGWISRNSRSRQEKIAISAGWQAQIDAQQSEHDRLAVQNKSLMEQISQYQASNKDAKMRAKELSDSLREAFERRDELQRQLKDIRGNLEVAVTERDQLQTDATSREHTGDTVDGKLEERDHKILRLSKELQNWQDRVPPLVERYRERDLEAQELEILLEQANEKIAALESTDGGEHTRIEPVTPSSLPDGLDASNEPHTETSVHSVTIMDDQIDDYGATNDDEVVEDDEVIEDDAATNIAAQPELESRTSVDGEYVAEVDQVEESAPAEDDELDEEPEEIAEDEELNEEPEEIAEDEELNEEPEEIAEDEEYSEALMVTDEDEESERAVEEDDFPNLLDNEYATGIQEPDDLRQIKGVGPAIEKVLNDLGIFRYSQIAEMSEYDIDRVASQLKGFRSRIYREDWMGQARSLHYEKQQR